MQHRVGWSDHGGTWGLPGGARRTGEDALAGALRESHEEAGVPADALVIRGAHTFDVGYWSYTTVLADVIRAFEPVIGDAESEALEWFSLSGLESLPLHPGLAAAWPQLRPALERRQMLVVDVANVMGSRPNGWWRDRVGAAGRLLGQLAALAQDGIPGPLLGHAESMRLWPQIVAVVEGQAVRATWDPPTPEPSSQLADQNGETPAQAAHLPRTGALRVVPAEADGDGAIVDGLAEIDPDEADVTVVTSDRELRARVERLGARATGASSLLRLLA